MYIARYCSDNCTHCNGFREKWSWRNLPNIIHGLRAWLFIHLCWSTARISFTSTAPNCRRLTQTYFCSRISSGSNMEINDKKIPVVKNWFCIVALGWWLNVFHHLCRRIIQYLLYHITLLDLKWLEHKHHLIQRRSRVSRRWRCALPMHITSRCLRGPNNLNIFFYINKSRDRLP